MTGEFAIAMYAMAILNHSRETISSESLARHVCAHPARVRKVMAKLKKGGLVDAKEGTDGGYQFFEDPRDVSLRDICEAVDACLITLPCHLDDMDRDCLAASGMGKIMEDLCEEMNAICKNRLREISLADIGRRMFGDGEE